LLTPPPAPSVELLPGLRLLRVGLGIAAPVGLALDGDDVCVVDDSVDEGGGASGVGERLGPVTKGQVGGEDERLLLVPARHDLEEQVGIAPVVGEVAHLIDA